MAPVSLFHICLGGILVQCLVIWLLIISPIRRLLCRRLGIVSMCRRRFSFRADPPRSWRCCLPALFEGFTPSFMGCSPAGVNRGSPTGDLTWPLGEVFWVACCTFVPWYLGVVCGCDPFYSPHFACSSVTSVLRWWSIQWVSSRLHHRTFVSASLGGGGGLFSTAMHHASWLLLIERSLFSLFGSSVLHGFSHRSGRLSLSPGLDLQIHVYVCPGLCGWVWGGLLTHFLAPFLQELLCPSHRSSVASVDVVTVLHLSVTLSVNLPVRSDLHRSPRILSLHLYFPMMQLLAWCLLSALPFIMCMAGFLLLP